MYRSVAPSTRYIVRPLSSAEKAEGAPAVVRTNSERREVEISLGGGGPKRLTKTYTFDRVFGSFSTQAEVFDSVVEPIVQETLQGFSCTVFAYGQTGTGTEGEALPFF